MRAMAAERGVFLDGERKCAMDVARGRLVVAAFLFVAAFCALMVRTVELGLSAPSAAPRQVAELPSLLPQMARADIVDRRGEVLATNLQAASLYADASRIADPGATAQALAAILPGLPEADIRARLASGKRFVWIRRKLTPRQKWQVNALGNPALGFRNEEERVYPHGRLAAHVLGHVDVDGNGLAGVEHYFNTALTNSNGNGQTLALSLDARVQYALADELEAAMRAHHAKGAAGVVMDVNTGEVLALVSLPDFDPNAAAGTVAEARFNRATQGVYELGSTFKTFTFAAALDNGIAGLGDGYDATKPLRVSRFLIRDDHPKARYLSLPEIFAYSSNIGTAQLALDLGTDRQRHFLDSIGLLQPAAIELTEVGAPLYPANWRKTATVTISYGHGIAVSPIQLARGIAAMVNGGRLIPATLVAKSGTSSPGEQVISASTSRKIRQLLRMAVKKGTGGRAEAVGYRVGGKTGTAEKPAGGMYDRGALISSFIGSFPMDDPQYVVFALLDEPRGIESTHGFASGGWTAAPVVRNVILRTAPLLGVAPRPENDSLYRQVALMITDDD